MTEIKTRPSLIATMDWHLPEAMETEKIKSKLEAHLRLTVDRSPPWFLEAAWEKKAKWE